MAQARRLGESDIYHVISRGVGKQLIFEDDDDRLDFLSLLKGSTVHFGVEVYAWCLMGNHVHLLLHAPMERISQAMQLLCGRYAQWFNERTGRNGHLFQERFKSEPVEDDGYLLTVLRYIHLNPDKAGIGSFETYRWSSYGEYYGTPTICAVDFVRTLFNGEDDFVRFHRLGLEEEGCLDVDGLRSATRAMPDSIALEIAREVLGRISLSDLKAQDKKTRDRLLVELKRAGISIRQIERLSGISKGIVAKAKVDK